MISISAAAVRKNPSQVITQVNESCVPVAITTPQGKGAVLVGEDEWAAIEETRYLVNIPGMTESLAIGRDTPEENCVDKPSLAWRG